MPDSHPDVVPLVRPDLPAPTAPPTRGPMVTFARFVLGGLPTLLVLAAIGGVGWYGSTHEWKVPKFSELAGEVPEKDDWCKDHKVPESICVECMYKKGLLPKPKEVGWCAKHEVPECVLCNPGLAHLDKTPVITDEELNRAAKSLATASPLVRECKTHLRRLQLASVEDKEKAGIDVDRVRYASVTEWVVAAGELGFDQTKVAHLSVRSAGSVAKVFKRLGQTVKAGEVLALVETPDVGKAKVEILQAFGTLQLKQQALAELRTSDVTARARIRDAEGAVREAELRLAGGCQALTNLGLPFDDTETAGLTAPQLKAKLRFRGIPPELAADLTGRTTDNLLPLFAPMDGLITSRDVVAGEVVDPAKILFEVVDPRSLWLTLDIKGEDADKITVGRTVRFLPDSARENEKEKEEVTATINWRSAQVDPKTRTLKVRADVPNPDGKLLANTYGTGRVITRPETKVLAVPPEAVQTDGCCQIVLVQDRNFHVEGAPKVFHVRKVRVGARDGGAGEVRFSTSKPAVEIVVGLLTGETVVTAGSGALVAELRKDELGDGCGCGKKD